MILPTGAALMAIVAGCLFLAWVIYPLGAEDSLVPPHRRPPSTMTWAKWKENAIFSLQVMNPRLIWAEVFRGHELVMYAFLRTFGALAWLTGLLVASTITVWGLVSLFS